MIRQIIKIDEELCNGCGLCVSACHEGAIGLKEGKARLLRDDYCDGLGNCLPVCPTGAITFEEREALEYDEEEVKRNMESRHKPVLKQEQAVFHGCPGSRLTELLRSGCDDLPSEKQQTKEESRRVPSMLRQWPVQLQLVPVNAPYFSGADLLIAADCTAYSYGDFHSFMRDKITLIGCPKLDDVDYAGKLAQIFTVNRINSITVIRMEVPCCGGIVHAVKTAMANSKRIVPWRVITISTDGVILEDTQ